MQRDNLKNMTGGWFVGDFQPSIIRNQLFEACVKKYMKGDTEKKHFQKISTEITVIISGSARMNDQILEAGDIIMLEPFEEYDFEALADVDLVAIKYPSIPLDKVFSEPNE